jgi:hypothetical protein
MWLQDETWSKYLKEGMEADVLTWSGTVVGVQIPNTVTLEVRVRRCAPTSLRAVHAAIDTDTGLHALRDSFCRYLVGTVCTRSGNALSGFFPRAEGG